MKLNDQDQPPSAEESMTIAAEFLRVAHQAADGDIDGMAASLDEYFTDDPVAASLRLWYFAAVGPLIVAGAVKKLNGGRLPSDGMWVIEQEGDPADDPSALAAAQAVTAHLNGDDDAARDVISAHFGVVAKKSGGEAAHEALFGVVVHHLNMLAALINEGVFAK
ncbi:hypothetical protein [Prauserella endophytica]|uniref:Uncharacterized protein n=1 Tax=Prauserella endophytica TaxID=1592324 RepID=A0ABY2S081_9PSEU|nr:hypothetical protein [Prauserella endophytica]PXY20352.1 hypothetical protein BAY59_31435 [Prauserella coralliicola]TKG66954.1 hypothetical protein FCN18_23880 [Prauserella endophytica]